MTTEDWIRDRRKKTKAAIKSAKMLSDQVRLAGRLEAYDAMLSFISMTINTPQATRDSE